MKETIHNINWDTKTGIFKCSNEVVTEFAKMLKEAGYKLYTPDYCIDNAELSHFTYTDGKGIAYCQFDKVPTCLHLSTVHKPCKGSGAGFRFTEDFEDITAETAKNAMYDRPAWARNNSITKYSDFEEYIKLQSGTYIEITEIV